MPEVGSAREREGEGEGERQREYKLIFWYQFK
jgi:hypothetical protein